MKLVDKYIMYKKKYPDYVILIRSGSFYNTFYDDAILINCLCNYKLLDNKIGFPSSVLNKIENILKYKNINIKIIN